MEEILHHLGCIKPCKYWDKLPTATGAGFLNHQQYVQILSILKVRKVILCLLFVGDVGIGFDAIKCVTIKQPPFCSGLMKTHGFPLIRPKIRPFFPRGGLR